jgi:hypothetical protein
MILCVVLCCTMEVTLCRLVTGYGRFLSHRYGANCHNTPIATFLRCTFATCCGSIDGKMAEARAVATHSPHGLGTSSAPSYAGAQGMLSF